MSNSCYQIFLSFKGEEVVDNFVDKLYEDLHVKGFCTFKDHERFQDTKTAALKLSKALEESSVFVVVLSHKYVSSSYCLDELVKIMRHKKNQATISIVFYDMSASDVRNQEESFTSGSSRAIEWVQSLDDATKLPARSMTKGNEEVTVKEIVQEICRKLAPAFSSDNEIQRGRVTHVQDAKLMGGGAGTGLSQHQRETFEYATNYVNGGGEKAKDDKLARKPRENSPPVESSATQQQRETFGPTQTQAYLNSGGRMTKNEQRFQQDDTVARKLGEESLSTQLRFAQHQEETLYSSQDHLNGGGRREKNEQRFQQADTATRKQRENTLPMESLGTQPRFAQHQGEMLNSTQDDLNGGARRTQNEQSFQQDDTLARKPRENSTPVESLAAQQQRETFGSTRYQAYLNIGGGQKTTNERRFQQDDTVAMKSRENSSLVESLETQQQRETFGSTQTQAYVNGGGKNITNEQGFQQDDTVARKPRENLHVESLANQPRFAQHQGETLNSTQHHLNTGGRRTTNEQIFQQGDTVAKKPRENLSPEESLETQHQRETFGSTQTQAYVYGRGKNTTNEQGFQQDGVARNPRENLLVENLAPQPRSAQHQGETLNSTQDHLNGGGIRTTNEQRFKQSDTVARKPRGNSSPVENFATQQQRETFGSTQTQAYFNGGGQKTTNEQRFQQDDTVARKPMENFPVESLATSQLRFAQQQGETLNSTQNHLNGGGIRTTNEQGFQKDDTVERKLRDSSPLHDSLGTRPMIAKRQIETFDATQAYVNGGAKTTPDEQRFQYDDTVARKPKGNSSPVEILATQQQRGDWYERKNFDSTQNYRSEGQTTPDKQEFSQDNTIGNGVESSATRQRVAQQPGEAYDSTQTYLNGGGKKTSNEQRFHQYDTTARKPGENSSPVESSRAQGSIAQSHRENMEYSTKNHVNSLQNGGKTTQNEQKFHRDDTITRKPWENSLAVESLGTHRVAHQNPRGNFNSTQSNVNALESGDRDEKGAKSTEEISSKSTPHSSSKPYHVFMSYNGEDDIKNFVGKLHNALHKQGFEVFRNDERLESTNLKAQELSRSMKESLVAVIILTENYTSSPLCKKELVKLLNSKESIIPVYHNVDPLNLHNEQGYFGRNVKDDWRSAFETLATASYQRELLVKGKEDETVTRIAERVLRQFGHVISSFDEKRGLAATETQVPFLKQQKEIKPGNESEARMNSNAEKPSGSFTNASSGKMSSKNKEASSRETSSSKETYFTHPSITSLPSEFNNVGQESSTSVNSIIKNRRSLDVFLSFTGEDIQSYFINNLNSAFHENNITSFMEDESQGDTERVIKAIKESRFSVVVFSRKYITSSRCLDQLVKIMECKETMDQMVFPVYVDMDTIELRKDQGTNRGRVERPRDHARIEASKLKDRLFIGKAHSGDVAKTVHVIVEKIKSQRSI